MPIIGGLIGSSRGRAGGVSPSASGITLSFSSTQGTTFTLEHNLNSETLTWNMWSTNVTPTRSVIPDDVETDGPNRIKVRLDTPMNGYIVLVPI